MPYPLLTGTTKASPAGISTPDLFGSTARVKATRATFQGPVPPVARTTAGVTYGPTLFAPPETPDTPPSPTTGQLWPRGTP